MNTTGEALAPAAAEVARFRALFESFEASRPQREPLWLTRLRTAAIERFERLGFPTTRLEDWRFTSVAPIARTSFQAADPRSVERVGVADLARAGLATTFSGPRIVFVNGRHAPQLSSRGGVEGLVLTSLREALAREPELLEETLAGSVGQGHAFAALNAAFLEDGAFVRVAPGAVLREPIQLVCHSTRAGAAEPTVSHPRSLILLGRASQAVVVESYLGASGETYLTNAVTDVALDEGALLDHYKVQQESHDAFHVHDLRVRQGRSSSFSSLAVSLGAALARNDVDQVFTGEGAECALLGLFLASGRQHTDTHTRIDHALPHCTSRELYKGVVDGRARGVFVGRILVREGAQKTDAQQTNKNLLLSREALVNSVPQLEILADDVKCKHGSTTGQLDPAALFYLRSRGIEEAAARSLLTYAFASDVVARIRPEPLQAALAEWLRGRLPGGGDLAQGVA